MGFVDHEYVAGDVFDVYEVSLLLYSDRRHVVLGDLTENHVNVVFRGYLLSTFSEECGDPFASVTGVNHEVVVVCCSEVFSIYSFFHEGAGGGAYYFSCFNCDNDVVLGLMFGTVEVAGGAVELEDEASPHGAFLLEPY